MGGSWCKSRRTQKALASCKLRIDITGAKVEELEGRLAQLSEHAKACPGVDFSDAETKIKNLLEATKLTHSRAYNEWIQAQAVDGLAPILHDTAKSARDLCVLNNKDTKTFDRVIDVTQQHDKEGDHTSAVIGQILHVIKKEKDEEEEDEMVGHYAPTTAVMMRDAPRVPSKKQQSPPPPNNNNLLLEIAQMN